MRDDVARDAVVFSVGHGVQSDVSGFSFSQNLRFHCRAVFVGVTLA